MEEKKDQKMSSVMANYGTELITKVTLNPGEEYRFTFVYGLLHVVSRMYGGSALFHVSAWNYRMLSQFNNTIDIMNDATNVGFHKNNEKEAVLRNKGKNKQELYIVASLHILSPN